MAEQLAPIIRKTTHWIMTWRHEVPLYAEYDEIELMVNYRLADDYDKEFNRRYLDRAIKLRTALSQPSPPQSKFSASNKDAK
ncbi:MAG: hypothetical protein WCK65_08220 [Rhodospirillaceae bacterium]